MFKINEKDNRNVPLNFVQKITENSKEKANL